MPTGGDVTLARPYSDTLALLPAGRPTAFGGYTLSYDNDTNGTLATNTHNLAATGIMVFGAYTGFTGPTGSFTTEIEGIVYVPVAGVSADVIPFATFYPNRSGGGLPTGVAGEFRMAARLGTNWFVSDSEMLNYTFLPGITTVSSHLDNLWRAFDPFTLTYGASQLLPTDSLTGIGVYFQHEGTLIKSGGGDYVSEVRLQSIGYITAVPEPGTYGLIAGAVLGLAIFVRRFKSPRN